MFRKITPQIYYFPTRDSKEVESQEKPKISHNILYKTNSYYWVSLFTHAQSSLVDPFVIHGYPNPMWGIRCFVVGTFIYIMNIVGIYLPFDAFSRMFQNECDNS